MRNESDLRVLINKEEITTKVRQLAQKINKDYYKRVPVLIGVLKGSFVFMADLIRQLSIEIEISFVELSSYDETESMGEVEYLKGLDIEIEGRDVVVIEDIVDTGLTLASLFKYLKSKNPSSLKLCALTSKPSRRKKEIEIDYLGFKVPNKFIVGYGIDYKEKYRQLSEIYYIKK
jgi:hypoxanthine phosphoribosyltransferase